MYIPELQRSDFIILAMLAEHRADAVRHANHDQYIKWQQAPAGSDEALMAHQIYEDNLRYEAELRRIYSVLDAATDAA
jgi:hypothetical protein